MATTRRHGGAETDCVPIGSSVRKYFDGHGWFHGKVISYDEKHNLYKVVYEDGDEEEYEEQELRKILMSVASGDTATDAVIVVVGATTTPAKETNVRTGTDMAESGGIVMETPVIKRRTSPRNVTPSPTQSVDGRTSGRLKRTSSSTTARRSLRPRKIKKVGAMTPSLEENADGNDHHASEQQKSSSKSSGITGETLEPKDEDFIPPDNEEHDDDDEDHVLPTDYMSPDENEVTPKKKKNTPRKAPRKGKGPVTTTVKSKKAPMSGTSTRSIVKWGLPRGALAKCPHSGFTLRALDRIPPHSNSNELLPGRLTIVAPDDKGICPTDFFVGTVFDSAEALHTAIAKHNERTRGQSPKIRFATYEMEAVSDPAFATWEFAMLRLSSAGLGTEEGKLPVLQTQIHWDGGTQLSGKVTYWQGPSAMDGSDGSLLWAFLEGDQLKEIPPVLLGVPKSLLEYRNENNMTGDKSEDLVVSKTEVKQCDAYDERSPPTSLSGSQDKDLVPQPNNRESARIKLAASLLEKSIRRGRKLCSSIPLLEASMELLHPTKACAGSTFAFLKALWACMLVDVSPFDESEGCLGLTGALLSSLIAKADPTWALPPKLRRCAVTSALRTAQRDKTQQWIGFVGPDDHWFRLEQPDKPPTETNGATETKTIMRATNLRNILRASQAVAGGRLSWGKWNKFTGDASAAAILSYLNHRDWDGTHLPPTPMADPQEDTLLDGWERGHVPALSVDDLKPTLDEECRLAAIEPNVMPQTLVLLQAVLDRPPTHWKKHALPSLSRQVRKLMSEANPRYRARAQLARLQTWGKDKSTVAENALQTDGREDDGSGEVSDLVYKSFREVVTPTGTLSEGEMDLVNCFESVQRWQLNRLRKEGGARPSGSDTTSKRASADTSAPAINCRITAGPALSIFDGRVAFLLAFASAIEVKVNGETVSAMFCGDADEPLLVQRIGKARSEGRELATAGGSTSGATAVPSLGYVQRDRSPEEAVLMEGAELAVAKHWKAGKRSALPLPPPGFQWEIAGGDTSSAGWDESEAKVERTAELCYDKKGKKYWRFSIGGTPVMPFDARPVISPCSLDIGDLVHRPKPLGRGSRLEQCLRVALYAPLRTGKKDTAAPFPQGVEVLEAISELHSMAVAERNTAPNEGVVYDWMPVAQRSLLPARAWRDALLAIRTRETDHVVLGKGIRSDGTGAPRDMTEGVLVRVFHALECLYPMSLRKENAFRFRVRPRGASYYHLLSALERLGKGEGARPLVVPSASIQAEGAATLGSNRKRQLRVVPSTTEDLDEVSPSLSKRPRRQKAIASSQKFAIQANAERGRRKKEDDETDPSFEIGEAEIEQEDDELVVDESDVDEFEAEEVLPLPKVTTELWAHQEASVGKVVQGVKEGRRGHADASAVGAGKTLTALATIVRLAQWMQQSGKQRYGTLVMLPTKALIREWLLEIAAHTRGFHVIEQREDGSLFSLTYAKSNPPIDSNALIITTLDRVCRHPFVRANAWDFIVIDECLSVQNADAKRNPSAWRQIEISTCGVLMLSATFFRSKYDSLFYMIRMLRSPLPRTMEWLPATIHEHIVCQIPETGRSWRMKGEMVSLLPSDLAKYREIIDAFGRNLINNPADADGRKLWVDLESFLRLKYEGRASRSSYGLSSVMGDAFARLAKKVLRAKRRPLVFADTSSEAEFLMGALRDNGLDARTWADIATKQIAGISNSSTNKTVIVAVKSVEGQGINMQRHADTILCRPTPGDHLEQMKGRIDRPGQAAKELHLYVVVCEHSIEESKFANIRLAGNFFREYIAPVATRYRERIDLEATLAAGGKKKLKRGTVSGTWRRSLETAGQSGCFAGIDAQPSLDNEGGDEEVIEEKLNDEPVDRVASTKTRKGKTGTRYKPLNKVTRNKGDPKAVAEAKAQAKKGGVSSAVTAWLFPSTVNATAKGKRKASGVKPLPKDSPLRFSDRKPALVLDRKTFQDAVVHLTKSDPKLGALIARVGPDALFRECGVPKTPTQARLFDRCLRAITFTQVSVDAGNAFLRRLSMKIGVCLESMDESRRKETWVQYFADLKKSGDARDEERPENLLQLLLQGAHNEILFTHGLVGELVQQCEILDGERSGYPHLCGKTFPCGKNDNHAVFLKKARAHANGSDIHVSAGYSAPKAGFLVSLVHSFAEGKISAEKIADASDREAAKMLTALKGIGDWCVGGILMHFLSRADVMLYGDLTVRNYLNEVYDISHEDSSETLLESAADFPDTGPNRNLIDEVAKKNGWEPYRSVVNYLMYHLQEENLVLL